MGNIIQNKKKYGVKPLESQTNTLWMNKRTINRMKTMESKEWITRKIITADQAFLRTPLTKIRNRLGK